MDKEKGLVEMIALQMGTSSMLCEYFQKGEKIVLMGPTGTPSFIPKNKKVLLIGGGLGNAVLFSIGASMKANNCEIIYAAGYKNEKDVFERHHIENSAHIVIWAADKGIIKKYRHSDYTYTGNIIEALEKFFTTQQAIKKSDFDNILVIGSDKMMYAIQNYLNDNGFNKNGKFFASINSPMQCMMKEICGKCIQKHVDKKNGTESFIYSCYNQDQEINKVDFTFLSNRLNANRLQEKLLTEAL